MLSCLDWIKLVQIDDTRGESTQPRAPCMWHGIHLWGIFRLQKLWKCNLHIYILPLCRNSKKFKYLFILTPFLSIFAEFHAKNWLYFVSFFSLIWPICIQFSASNSAKLERNVVKIRQYLKWNIHASSFNRVALCIAKLKYVWSCQQKGAIHTMSTAWSQWFQTNLTNRCYRMSKNCHNVFCITLLLTKVQHIPDKSLPSLYFFTSIVTAKVDLKCDVVKVFSRMFRHW